MEGYFEHYGVGDYDESRFHQIKTHTPKPSAQPVKPAPSPETAPKATAKRPWHNINIKNDKNLSALFEEEVAAKLERFTAYAFLMEKVILHVEKLRSADIDIRLRLITASEKVRLGADRAQSGKPLFLLSVCGQDHILCPENESEFYLTKKPVDIHTANMACQIQYQAQLCQINLDKTYSADKFTNILLEIAVRQTALARFGERFGLAPQDAPPVKRSAKKARALNPKGKTP